MLIKHTLSLLAFQALCLALSGGEPTPSPETILNTLRHEHPRLILTESRVAELKALAATDPLLKKAIQDVVARADKALDDLPLKYEKKGPRLLEVSRACLTRVWTLGVAWRFTGDLRYARKLEHNLLAVCAFPDWNPSHFLDVAEMSHAVGLGYDWCFAALEAQARGAIKTALIAKGLRPGLEAYFGNKPAWWTKSEFNWNQVCNGGLSIGALAIADSDPEYAQKIIPQVVHSLPKALASYDPDGAWGEGVAYWRYATDYTVYGLAALQTALGTDFQLSEHKGLAQCGFFPVYGSSPAGMMVSFADVSGNSKRYCLPTLLWLAGRYTQPVLAESERAAMAQLGSAAQAVVWYQPAPEKPIAPLPLDRLFRGPVEVAFFRGSWHDKDALYLCLKAGYNAVNHGHLDLGNFELHALGECWARDLGSDDYNLPGYWEGKQAGRRWSYYRLNSLSHNLCVLDGKNQAVAGKAAFEKFESREAEAFGIVDVTSAYPGLARKATRGAALIQGRRAALVQDEFEIDGKREIAWGMTTDAQIQIGADWATLAIAGKMLRARILAPEGAKFSEESAEQAAPQAANKGMRRLMIRLKEQAGALRIAVLFEPVWPDGKAAETPKVRPLAEW